MDHVTGVLKHVNLSDSSARSSPRPSPGVAGRRRGIGLRLGDITGAGVGPSGAGLGAGRPSALDAPLERPPLRRRDLGTPFSNFGKIVYVPVFLHPTNDFIAMYSSDPSGALNFAGKAVLHASGVDFSNGSSFAINMDELELHEEIGKGNYGTVKKVRHKPTNVLMAMKVCCWQFFVFVVLTTIQEIRLELDDSKLNAIIMELDILHRAISPQIVEFYGAFFIESCVYYCMEYMDGGSLDKLTDSNGLEEFVLARITHSVVNGLKFLKDSLQIMHRGKVRFKLGLLV